MTRPRCLRCKTIELVDLGSSCPEIEFFWCPACERNYARKPGKGLTFRWLNPISLVLYAVRYRMMAAFDAAGGDLPRLVDELEFHVGPDRLWLFAREMRLEERDPTQQLRDILDTPAPEDELRRFLGQIAREVDRRQYGSRRGEETRARADCPRCGAWYAWDGERCRDCNFPEPRFDARGVIASGESEEGRTMGRASNWAMAAGLIAVVIALWYWPWWTLAVLGVAAITAVVLVVGVPVGVILYFFHLASLPVEEASCRECGRARALRAVGPSRRENGPKTTNERTPAECRYCGAAQDHVRVVSD